MLLAPVRVRVVGEAAATSVALLGAGDGVELDASRLSVWAFVRKAWEPEECWEAPFIAAALTLPAPAQPGGVSNLWKYETGRPGAPK